MHKNIQSQDSQTTFKPNLTCIFLSVRANLEYPLCHGGPCICQMMDIFVMNCLSKLTCTHAQYFLSLINCDSDEFRGVSSFPNAASKMLFRLESRHFNWSLNIISKQKSNCSTCTHFLIAQKN